MISLTRDYMLPRITCTTCLLLVISALVPVSSAADRGHRAARLSSIWDVILPPPKQPASSKFSTDIQTNRINTEAKVKSSFKAPRVKTSNFVKQKATTHKPRLDLISSDDGRRKIVLSLMDVYHCPTRGVFPIDGDCERFLMCRNASNSEGKANGKIYRCPKGYLFSVTGARCQPEDSVACHRSQPLASLMKHARSRGDLLLLP